MTRADRSVLAVLVAVALGLWLTSCGVRVPPASPAARPGITLPDSAMRCPEGSRPVLVCIVVVCVEGEQHEG